MFFCACACVSHSWSRYVPLTKQKRGTTKQVLNFSYSGINNGKRTCCSLEVAFPELQNLYVQKKGIFEGQAYEHLINLLDPVQANGWVEVSPSGTAITARTRHSAVWDSTNGRMWVFGGYGPLLSVVQHAYSTYWKSVREIRFGKATRFKK